MRFLLALVLALAASLARADALIVVTHAAGCSDRIELKGTTASENFARLEMAIEVDGKPGDRVVVEGEFLAGPLQMLDLANIAGGALEGPAVKAGEPYRGRLIMLARHDRIGPEDKPLKAGGPAIWFPANGSIELRNLYLENSPEEVVEDGALAGWPGSLTGDSRVVLENLEVKAHDWGLVYDWSLRVRRDIVARNVRGVAARGFFCLMHAASTYSLDLTDCDLGIDGSLSVSYGATSAADPVTGGVLCPLMVRAGSVRAVNCNFWVKGMVPPAGFPAKWIPTRIVSVFTDQFYSNGAKDTTFDGKACTVGLVEPHGASLVYLLDLRYGARASIEVTRAAAVVKAAAVNDEKPN